jgi:RNA polymerase sigma factor (sigma-70 family)
MDQERLAERFERHRDHLRRVAYRMLGTLYEADDAVQEAWLRFSRADRDEVDNVAGWLTTAVARICLDQLRARAARREHFAGTLGDGPGGRDPAEEAEIGDAVGRALLVVLDTLAPDERVAFVLHDVFAVPFAEIAPIVSRTPAATKKLGSRARLKVRAGARTATTTSDLAGQRRVVETFLTAVRTGDLATLLRVLAPDVVRRADPAALPAGAAPVLRGATEVANEARLSRRRARFAEVGLVDGRIGAVVSRGGRVAFALGFQIVDGRIVEYEVIGDPRRLDRYLDLDLAAGDATPGWGCSRRPVGSV